MEKVLDQHEIDAIVQAARGASADRALTVTQWDYKQIGHMGGEHLEAISALHESFARNLTNSIGAYLRIGFQAGLASAEHLSYREFLGGIPERSYLGSVKLEPIGAAALIQMDLAIAFLLIDVLLGGEGTGQAPAREITEIEDQILETVMRLICRELQNVWEPLGVEFQFEQRQQPGRVQHLLPVEEKTLGLSFELTVKETKGLMSIAVPAVVSGALLRKISAARPRAQGQMKSKEFTQELRRKLLGCSFRLDLQLNGLGCSAKALSDLSEGKVLELKRRADGLAQLVCGERVMFPARVVRVRQSRAAQIVPPPENFKGEG
jgi:flagellar motor switch protein FliM